ncbi:MAG: nuclease A inhibitor family protein, partial [Cyanobacteria bacterium P01_E01_bin.43]
RETPSTELTLADEKQMELLNFLQSRCVSVEVHVVSKNDALSKWDRDHPDEQSIIEPFEGFPIILAETDTDEWVGIAPEVYFEEWYDYRPHEEESLWSTAFLFRNNVPIDDRADCYVRFNLESLLSRLDVPLRLKSGRATTVKQRFLELHEDKLPKIMAYQNTQAEEATLSLIEEIKQRLMGMELWTKQFFEPNFHAERFVVRVSKTKQNLLSSLATAAGFTRASEFLNLNSEDDLDEYDSEAVRQSEARLKVLDQWMTDNLKNLRSYEVGCMSVFYVYKIGQNVDGDWVGVTTVGIWT